MSDDLGAVVAALADAVAVLQQRLDALSAQVDALDASAAGGFSPEWAIEEEYPGQPPPRYTAP